MEPSIDTLRDARMLYREDHRDEPEFWSAASPDGMVATAHYRATAAGVEILEQGGNAVDAAIAASLTMGVVDPASSGLGGMALMILALGGGKEVVFLDGSCRPPVRATPEAVAASLRYTGYRSVAVPTLPAVLDFAHGRWGSFRREVLFEPAIRSAESGVRITRHHVRVTKRYRKSLSRRGGGAVILNPDGSALTEGSLFRQPMLAATLRRLRDAGFQDYYTGRIAARIAGDMRIHGGFLAREDLERVPWPDVRKPLTGFFGGMTVHTAPPPGGGDTLLQMLHVFDELSRDGFSPTSPDGTVMFAHIIRRARIDRIRYFRNASRGTIDPLEQAHRRHATRTADRLPRILDREGDTTHICVMDRAKNVVSMTQSIERSFGAKVATPDLGFFYNGYLRAFKIRNKRHPNYLRPGARARSNAAPTILFADGEPRVATGSTGSERIASSIFQVLVRLRTQTPFEAVSAPRLHATPGKVVWLEADRFPRAALDALRSAGFEPRSWKAWSFQAGGLQLATYRGGIFEGTGDPRRDGAAAGPRSGAA